MHNFTGTTIGMLHIMLPFMVLPLYASMRSRSIATTCGPQPTLAPRRCAPFGRSSCRCRFPDSFAGIIIVFVLCLGFYVTPALLGGGRVYMWSMQIERNVTYHADWGAASALGVVLLVITLGILWAVGRLIGFERIVGSQMMLARPATETQITHGRRLWLYLLGGPRHPVPCLAEPACHSAEFFRQPLSGLPAARLVDAVV